MGRGFNSKQARIHNRAKAAGRSTRGSSNTACNQRNGKLYKKGEIKFDNTNPIKKIVVDGVTYEFEYQLDNGKIIIVSPIYNYDRLLRCNASNDSAIKSCVITDNRLKMKIVKTAFGL